MWQRVYRANTDTGCCCAPCLRIAHESERMGTREESSATQMVSRAMAFVLDEVAAIDWRCECRCDECDECDAGTVS